MGRDSIRTFICIDIDQAIKSEIESLQGELRRLGAQVSWTKPSNIHLTIKFLGDVSMSRIEDVRGAVERAAAGRAAFEIEVGGAGCFPSLRNPRVLWVGLKSVPGALKELHAAIESELYSEGFPRETKKFSPHLTIGRVRSPHNATLVAEELIERGIGPARSLANEVIVMRSDLRPSGSIYTPIAITPLGS
ncbi:MAG TPA: RNA 2',3'-cyclic phosphodiesterase [Blastocatellia bacterium]|nr:RNA 2',3'-cyclic phosphodiesterase [Blastocatellia bacterium]